MDKGRFKRARTLRTGQTSAEAKLWRALRHRQLVQWKFRRQHPIGRYVADFTSLEGMLVVEVDGDTHFALDAEKRDAERTREIEALGFLVVRVSNIDVFENLEGVLDVIVRTLRQQH
jgi:very-short-patch-repair endonuclease